MPGYILHLTAAHMFLNTLPEGDPLRCRPDLQNDFYIGNLLPDAVGDKTASHFRNPKYLDHMIVWPRPEEFRRKYASHMNEPVYLGYYFHLYIDKVFFSEYLPLAVEFLNENGQPAELLRDVCSVRIKKNGQMITRNQYLSEEYYYGDYTKMNTWLCERYHLPEYLNPPCDPGIKEIEYSRLSGILDSLKEYRKVPVNAVRDVMVFDVEKLMRFLEEAASGTPPVINRGSVR